MGKGKEMITLRELKEKAVSKQQQKLMGLALSYKRGDVPDSEVSDTVKDLAKSMSTKELEDFASTKHKGLPQKKEDNNISNRSAGLKPQTYNDPNTGKKKVRMVPTKSNIVKTNDRVDEAFKKGDVVKVNLGPHKHLKHEVIHAFDDGTYNIKPYDLAPSKNRYRGGAIQVKSNQIKKLDEAKDPGEYDQEGDMAKTQLKTIMRNASDLADLLDDNENMPEWVQNKITKASDYITSAYNYMASEDDEEKEVKEYLEAGTDAIRKSYAKMTPGQTNELSTGADRAAAAAVAGIAGYGVKKAIDRFDPVKVRDARKKRMEREAEKRQAQQDIARMKREREQKRAAKDRLSRMKSR